MGGPAYPPSLTSSRVTLPKVERNTWPLKFQQWPPRPIPGPFFSPFLSAPALPTLAKGGSPRQSDFAGCDRRQSTARAVDWQRAHHSPRPASPFVICSYRSSQGTWTGGQAGSESPPHPEKASRGRRWIGCKPKIKPYFRPPMPDLICPNVEFDQFRVFFIGTTHLLPC